MQTKWLARIVGLVILFAAAGAAFLLWVTVGVDMPIETPGHIVEETFFNGQSLLYSTVKPPPRVFWAAVAIAVIAASVVAAVEGFAARRATKSRNERETPLAPIIQMEQTSGPSDPVTVTVLIPAHNEQDALPVTLPSLAKQSRQPDRIIVVADNCTDATVQIALEHGVEVFETVGNTLKKAGALNQALAGLLPEQGDNDVIMVMDADTALDSGFIAAAVQRLEADRALMAVGGIFYGEEGHGLIGQFQRNEYIRYSRVINRRRGKVFVLTGTSSVFRPAALRAVAEARNVTIPGVNGDVYDTIALTEDNELTIALKSLGARMVSPPGCTVVTELMPTWRNLWKQRMRWQRGALENIGAYGITPATARYWAQQMGIGYSVIAFYSFMLLMLLTILAVDVWVWFPFWLAIGAVFIVEQVVTVWRGGWKARILAASFFPELFYSMFIQAVFVVGIVNITLGRTAKWGHVQHGDAPVVAEAE